MAKYPVDFDVLTTASANATVSKDAHPKLHNDVNDALNAVQAELGLELSGPHADLAARLAAIESAISAVETGDVNTVFGRSGTVTAQAGDYSVAQVAGLSEALAAKQGLDSDLTAISALGTTAFGRGLLTLADAAAGRTALGLGSVLTDIAAIDLGKDWSLGDNVLMFSAAVTPGMAQIKDGTTAAPVEAARPTVKVSRKENLTVAQIEALGGVGTDGADVVAALQAMSEGHVDSETQTVGLYAGAKNKSSVAGGNPDACALYAVGNITGGSAPMATGIGACIVGRREAAAPEADVSGLELVTHNRAAASNFAAGGHSEVVGLWLVAAGTADSGAGITIGNPHERRYKVGYHIASQNGGAVVDSSFRDDGQATVSLDLRGKHAYALKTDTPEAGAVVIGHSELVTPNALLEVMNDVTGRDPLVVFGSLTNAQKYTMMLRNAGGSIRLLVAGAANDFFTGTVAGDSGMEFTAGKGFWIGAVGKTPKLRITENGIAFYGVAPVVRAAAIAEPTESLASLKAAVNGLRSALKNIGITE